MLFRGKYAEDGGVLRSLRIFLAFMWADMARLLKVETLQYEAVDFFCNIIKSQIAERQKSGRQRADFIDAMMQVQLNELVKCFRKVH